MKAYDRWLRRIPVEFHRSVLGESVLSVSSAGDSYQLATLRNYRSLMPLAQDARTPMFDLRAGDGALGSAGRLVQTCFREFEGLAGKVMERPTSPSGPFVTGAQVDRFSCRSSEWHEDRRCSMARRQTYEGYSLGQAVRLLAEGHHEARTRHISADEYELLLRAAEVLDRDHVSLMAFS